MFDITTIIEAAFALIAVVITAIVIPFIKSKTTVAQQQQPWDNYEKKFGLEYTKQYVAIPGHSEHHTGLAIDVSFVVDGKIVYQA